MNKYLLAALLFFVPATFAQADLKVAVIDLGRTFDEFYKTKDASARIDEKKEAFQKEIDDAKTEYGHMVDDAKRLYDESQDPTLSPAARKDKTDALTQKNKDLLSMQNKIQEMATERSNEIKDEIVRRHKEIVDEITKTISDYSTPQGFDLVLDKSSVSASSAVPVVLFNSTKLVDITADVITKLNSTAPAGGTPDAGSAPAPSGIGGGH